MTEMTAMTAVCGYDDGDDDDDSERRRRRDLLSC